MKRLKSLFLGTLLLPALALAGVISVVPSSDLYDSFNGSGAIDSNLWDTYEDGDTSSVLTVTQSGGKYTAVIDAGDPTGDAGVTTWFETDQGLMHYVTISGNFDVVLRNAGLAASPAPDAGDYQFCGLIVWLSSHNYEFLVVGERGADQDNTLEFKITDDTSGGDSDQGDLGANAAWSHKADLRVTRTGSTVQWYYQQPGTSPDSWTEVTSSFDGLSKSRISFGTGAVRIGIVPYGFGFVADFTCEVDQAEIHTGTPQ